MLTFTCLILFILRYLAAVYGGVRNPLYRAVAAGITEGILKSRAEKDGPPAVYRSREEQEQYLNETYKRFEEKEGVWSAAAAKVRLGHHSFGHGTRY